MISLTHILKEAKDGDFGNVAFGDTNDNPQFAQLQGAKPGSEKDTALEKKMYTALTNWKMSADKGVANFIYQNKALLPNLIKGYPKVFKPTSGTVYRGYGGTATNVEKVTHRVFDLLNLHPLAKKMMELKWKKAKGGYLSSTPIDYTPHINLQSWTPFKSVADRFNKTGITLVTNVANLTSGEWILNPASSEMFWEAKGGEGEILHVGTKYSSPVHILLNEWGWNELQLVIKTHRMFRKK